MNNLVQICRFMVDGDSVYVVSNDDHVIAKRERGNSVTTDLLAVWRESVITGGCTEQEVPEHAAELLSLMHERGENYYELWNAWGRRVATHTIKDENVTQTRYISMGRRLLMDRLTA